MTWMVHQAGLVITPVVPMYGIWRPQELHELDGRTERG